jgi:trigger factor
MATVTRENIGLLNDKLIVQVTKEEYLPNFDKALKNHSKNANLPGFRKGMVPAGLVKKMYGQSVFQDEVLKNVEKGLFDYLETEKLDIFAQPIASEDNDIKKLDCNSPADYTFGFEIGLRPIVQVAPLTKAKLTNYKVTVTDEMVNNEVEALQQKFGKMTDGDAVNTIDNVLNITFTPIEENGETTEDGTPKSNSLVVKYFTKKYQDILMTKKQGDTMDIVLNEAFEGKELEFVLQDLGIDAGNRKYKMEITKVGLIIPAELNEEFFVGAFPNKEVKTIDDAKKELRADIENHWATQAKNKLQDGIYHYLVDETTVEFPETFLKKWMQTGREKPSTAEEVEIEYPQFSKSLKWTLISDTLSKENNLTAGQDDIKDFARKQLMGYMGISELNETHGWVEDYAVKMLSDKKFVEDTYHRVVTEKLFDWTTTQVKTTEKEISIEDFTKLMKEHKH